MIILTSDHILNTEGYVNTTDFTVTVRNLPTNTFINYIEYIWGDNTKKRYTPTGGSILFTTPIIEVKKYNGTGLFNLKVIVSYTRNNKRDTLTANYNIRIKPIPNEIYLTTTTTRSSASKLYARITRFNFIPNPEIFGQNLENLKYVQWDLGNGVLSNRPQLIRAAFNEPGVFVVRMLAYTKGNDKYEYQRTFTIQEYLNDSIRFSKVPPPTYAGHLNRFPFEIEITSPINEPHIVDLYAQFSRSYPTLDNPTKYSFLRPEWRFLDSRLNVIKSVQTTNNRPIRVNEFGEEISEGGIIAGYKGTAKFYFVDDWFNQDQVLTKQQYTTLWATLRSNNIRNNKTTDNIDGLHPGHANNTAQAWCPYVTLWRKPDIIKFTRNGANPLPVVQFVGSDVPITFTIGYNNPTVPDVHNRQARLTLADTIGGFAHYVPHYDTNLLLDINTNSFNSNLSSFLKPKQQPYISYRNSDNLLSGGYYKTTYERLNSTTLTMSANIVIPEPDLRANNFNPHIWLLNPSNAEINVAQYIYTTNNIINSPQYFKTDSITNYYELFKKNKTPIATVKKNPNMDTVFLYKFETEKKINPHISSPLDEKSHLSGLHTVAALNAPTYHAWVSDIENNKIYRVTSDGRIYLTIDLKNLNYNFGSLDKLIPLTMVVDKDLNLFVGLAGSNHILKFDDSANLRAVLSLTNIMPISLDVDKDNNLYISGIRKNQTKESVLLKYNNSLSNLILSKTYSNIFLGNILVSPFDTIFVVNNGHLDKNLKEIYSINSFIEELNINNFNLVKSYSSQPFIKYMTLDRNGSLYYNFSFNSICKIKRDGRSQVTSLLSDNTSDTDNSIRIIEGLSYNINDKIYVINSLDNKVTVLDLNLNVERFFYINPSKIEYEINDFGQIKDPLVRIRSKKRSLKANGDFTGWLWNYKFGVKNNQESFSITTRSKTLSFRQHNQFKFFGKNEVFDIGKYMYDFSFMKSLKESPFLYNNKFYDNEVREEVVRNSIEQLQPLQRQLNTLLNNNDFSDPELIEALQNEINKFTDDLREVQLTTTNKKGFFGSIFGTFPYQPDDLGVSTFSKIANFTEKTADPDTCDVPHLYDIMKKIDFNDESYRIRFPNGINRIIDYASISPYKLMGTKCGCGNDNFKLDEYQIGTCSFCGREIISNRGDEIKNPQQIVDSGNFVVLKNKTNDKFRKIQTGPLDGENSYTITKLATSIGLPTGWMVNYAFYKYEDKPNDFIETRLINIDTFDLNQSNNIKNIASYFNLNNTFISPVSTYVFALTTNINIGTTNMHEWSNNLNLLSNRTIINFVSSLNLTLSSMSYVWETSSSVNFNNYEFLTSNIFNIPSYRKGLTLTNTTSSISYKRYIELDKKYRVENNVDWDQTQTTIPLMKSENAWYGQNGILETMINFELQKGLGLI
jgi:hypothetical protein